MIPLSLRALAVGIGLDAVLVVTANLFSLPIGLVYAAFVVIVAVSVYLGGADAGLFDRPARGRRARSRSAAPPA